MKRKRPVQLLVRQISQAHSLSGVQTKGEKQGSSPTIRPSSTRFPCFFAACFPIAGTGFQDDRGVLQDISTRPTTTSDRVSVSRCGLLAGGSSLAAGQALCCLWMRKGHACMQLLFNRSYTYTPPCEECYSSPDQL